MQIYGTCQRADKDLEHGNDGDTLVVGAHRTVHKGLENNMGQMEIRGLRLSRP